MATHSVLLPGKSRGWRSLVGCSPWGCKESDMTEWLHFHFSLSCVGEGHGNPLQCSCLENPRDGGAWWAAVYGVAQSLTQLQRLSSRAVRRLKEQAPGQSLGKVSRPTKDWLPKEAATLAATTRYMLACISLCSFHSLHSSNLWTWAKLQNRH